MKPKNKTVIALIVLGTSLLCSFFGGFGVVAGGLGSIFPVLDQVARPIVCGSDVMQAEQHVNTFRPGSTSYTITVYCVDDTTGVKQDVTGRAQAVLGLISSTILFIPFCAVLILLYVLITRGINKIRQQQEAGGY